MQVQWLALGPGVDGVAAGGAGARRALGDCAPLPLAVREGRRIAEACNAQDERKI